jgi:hypothetical protein
MIKMIIPIISLDSILMIKNTPLLDIKCCYINLNNTNIGFITYFPFPIKVVEYGYE